MAESNGVAIENARLRYVIASFLNEAYGSKTKEQLKKAIASLDWSVSNLDIALDSPSFTLRSFNDPVPSHGRKVMAYKSGRNGWGAPAVLWHDFRTGWTNGTIRNIDVSQFAGYIYAPLVVAKRKAKK